MNTKVLIVCCISLIACSKRDKVSNAEINSCNIIAETKIIDNDTLTICDPKLVKDTVIIPFSSLVEKLELIRLDTCQQALCTPGRGGKSAISEHYIATVNFEEPIRLFNRATGKYLCQIGNIGQGPGEYMGFGGKIDIDEKNNRIFTHSLGKLLSYDLEGNFIESHQLAFPCWSNLFYWDIDKKQISGITNNSPTTFSFWIEKNNGDVIQGVSSERMKLINHAEPIGYNDKGGNSIYVFQDPAVKDSLYRYDMVNNKLVPHFTLKWNTDEIDSHLLFEFSDYYCCTLNNPLPILINKQTRKGAYAKIVFDEWGNIPFTNLFRPLDLYSNRYFKATVDPLSLSDELRKVLEQNDQLSEEQRKNLQELRESISNDENSWVIVGEWK